MRPTVLVLVLAFLLVAGARGPWIGPGPVAVQAQATTVRPDAVPSPLGGTVPVTPAESAAREQALARYLDDLSAVQTYRPAYPFWQHIFTIPDGRILFGSAQDGRLLVSFPTRGNWGRDGDWADASLRPAVEGKKFSSRLTTRRDEVSELLEPLVGAVVHNPTRGLFLMPNAEKFGSFLLEWGKIYERFGVPAEIGLAQAVLESGLDGRARSGARALGFCQWLSRNWSYLDRLSPDKIEVYNQTTQAPYCAAYLSILSTMYGSFIPALSEHHAGGVNVGRTVINGERLGGQDAREQYFIGSQFAVDLRDISIRRYRELFRTYGPRSFLYAEMVFGNTLNVTRMMAEYPQERIFAMRVARNLPLSEVTRRSGLSASEAKRFNPALVRQVPAHANVYLPDYIEDFGPDVSFWHRPPTVEFASVLNEFLRIKASVQRWHEPEFAATLQSFQKRFEDTETEEGTVMATTLAYVISDLRTSRRAAILDDFRTSNRILQLFRRGVQELGEALPGRL